jgi:hypothetical protein
MAIRNAFFGEVPQKDPPPGRLSSVFSAFSVVQSPSTAFEPRRTQRTQRTTKTGVVATDFVNKHE